MTAPWTDGSRPVFRVAAGAACLWLSAGCALGQAADPPAAPAPTPNQSPIPVRHVLTNRSGQGVEAPSQVHGVTAEEQIPSRVTGGSTDPAVIQKIKQVAAARGEADALKFFPVTFSTLMPYLDSTIAFGNTCAQPGAFISSDPLSTAAQGAKSWLAGVGLEYSLDQAFLISASTNRASGDALLSSYSYRFLADWKVVRDAEFNGWVSFGANGGTGLGVDWSQQSPAANAGSFNSPAGGWYGVNSWADELAWGMSFFGGKLAVMAGVVNQSDYFDENTFANTSYGQLLNSAFIDSEVLPMPGNNLGINVLWQPVDSFYLMAGAGAINQPPGSSPFQNLSAQNAACLLELGFIDADFLSLGRGVLRVQPFLATVAGETGGGLCLNIEQQLGHSSPLGLFGRFGACEQSAASVGGANAEATLGLVAHGPFAKAGSSGPGSNDYLGLAFAWTRQASNGGNEHAIELTYAMQLTPTVIAQPDFQVILDPANNPGGGTVCLFQFQITLSW